MEGYASMWLFIGKSKQNQRHMALGRSSCYFRLSFYRSKWHNAAAQRIAMRMSHRLSGHRWSAHISIHKCSLFTATVAAIGTFHRNIVLFIGGNTLRIIYDSSAEVRV